MSNVIELVTRAEREKVADYAAYSVGSAFDDWDPRVGREYDKVMRSDVVFAVWRERMRDFERQRAAGCVAILCSGAPVSEG